MKRKKKLITVLFLSLLSSFSVLADQDFRNWTNKDGNSIEAKFIKFKDAKIEIRRKDGFTFTLDPSTLSQEDQDYLKELKKRTDSRGMLWTKASATYELTRQKWFDTPKDRAILYYHTFKKEKVDLDKDGVSDGYKVLRRANGGVYRDSKIKAWDVTEDGHLLYRQISFSRIVEAKLRYDFETKSFLRISGSGPGMFISAE